MHLFSASQNTHLLGVVLGVPPLDLPADAKFSTRTPRWVARHLLGAVAEYADIAGGSLRNLRRCARKTCIDRLTDFACKRRNDALLVL